MEITYKMASRFLMCFLGFFLVIMVGFAIFAFFMIPQIRYGNTPEQSEQAEVAEKEVYRTTSGGKGSSNDIYTYYISFKFPDGSVKELEVGRDSVRGSKREPYCFAYDSLNEGDTGIITYKELKNAENRLFPPYEYRLFISFEKDPEYGGLKVEMYEESIETWEIVLAVIIIVLALLFLFYAIRGNKKVYEIRVDDKGKFHAIRVDDKGKAK